MSLRVGLIGAGFWAEAAHAPGLQRAGATIAGVLSRTPGRATSLAERYGATVYPTLAAMAPHVDAVAIVTPNDSHLPYALEAIEHGLHVFIDKPLAKDLAGAKAIAEAAKARGIVGMTTLSSRGHPALIRARELLEEGVLGEILYVRGYFHAEFMADPQAPLAWRAQRGPAGAGALADLGAHLFDLVRYTSGLEFVSVSALTAIAFAERPGGPVENDDEVAMLARLQGGVSAVLSLSRVHTGGPQAIEVELQGTKAAMRVRPALSVNARNGGLMLAERSGSYRDVALEDRLWGASDQPIPWELPWGEFVFTELARRFLHAIETGSKPSPSLEDGVAAQAVIAAAERSSAQGGSWIAVSL